MDKLDIRKGNKISINNRETTCPKDVQVCCKKQEGKSIIVKPKVKPPYVPKCGQHHSEGLDVKVR